VTEAALLEAGRRLHDVRATIAKALAEQTQARGALDKFRLQATSAEPLPREKNAENFVAMCKLERQMKAAEKRVQELYQLESTLWETANQYAQQADEGEPQ
jgi:hypothetical protein